MNNRPPLNIGYIENSSKIGGANRSMETLLKGLKGGHFRPYFSCPEPGPMVKLIQSLDIPVEIHSHYQPTWKSPFQTYRYWKQWGAFIRNNSLALLHANGLYGGRSAVLASWAQNIPLLCHIRFPDDEQTCQWIFHRLPKPAGFIFISKSIHAQMGSALQIASPSSRQWVVYNGVDIDAFTPVPAAGNRVPRIGIIANLQKIKGHEDFLDMAKLLTQKGHDAHYDIIGDDIQQQGRMKALQAYSQQLGLTERVRFHGQVDNVPVLLRQLDIIVCASHIEPFGRCLIEGMACGKPIVATRVGGIPEVVEDRKTGFLVAPHAPGVLADAVSQLLGDPALREHMGKQGRARVERLFSLEAHTASIIKIYQETLGLAQGIA